MNSIVTSVILAIVALASFVTCNIENQSNNLANASIAQRKCIEYAHNACNAPLTASQLKHLDFSSLKLPQDEVASLKRNSNHTFIVGGRTAYEGQFPHMARIGYKNIFIRSLECGGSLISHNYILSAAHCASYQGVFRTHPANWAVLGSYHQDISLDKHNEEFTIINIIIHPDYNDETLEGDIALYKINREVQFNEFIRPICLNTLADINYPILTVSGWGDTRSEGPPSEFLKYVTLSFQPDEQCLKLFPAAPAKFNETTMICAGYAPGEKDACQGDSGGPLVINLLKSCSVPTYVQLGIVSFGKRCGEKDTPAVYTRVSYYLPWIESIVWPQQ